MEILLAFGVIVLIWIVAKAQSGNSAQSRPSVHRASARATRQPSTRDAIVHKSAFVSADDCWVPPGRDATVAGYTIHGGMLYVGQGLLAINGPGIEPALIDPSLPVNRANPDRAGAGMTYWPSYSSISPECRAAYLDWLATGRRDPGAYIGYVFLYFYGLERRVLAEASTIRASEAGPSGPHCRGRATFVGVQQQRFVSRLRNAIS